jgi:hypothetical protein
MVPQERLILRLVASIPARSKPDTRCGAATIVRIT